MVNYRKFNHPEFPPGRSWSRQERGTGVRVVFERFRSKLRLSLPRVNTHKKRNRWLELIALYKLLQAALLVSVGVGVLKLLHKDVADVLSHVARELRMNPEGHLVGFLLEKSAMLDDHRLHQISLFLFGYAALGVIEGLGLMLEKVWAEYFTAFITASFLPIEIFELMHRVTWLRVGLFVVNLAVLVYLVSHLIRRRAEMGRQARLI
jgi:uncharacterized membrane protein (DUF2068 family)